ncbi:MAG: hypothetical protein PF961_10170 [Planctomycetota bacterium]|jgi:hypothetical protein|nr:hypothetical protein [Planctomycetota bacterium]
MLRLLRLTLVATIVAVVISTIYMLVLMTSFRMVPLSNAELRQAPVSHGR